MSVNIIASRVIAITLPLLLGYFFAVAQEPSTRSSDSEHGREVSRSGTITEYSPGSAIVLKESSGPRLYRFGKVVTYITKSGKTLDEATVKEKIRVGVPVHVHYVGSGDDMIVDRVILDED
jgi:hypothetical protein